jgi:hypothetical protein
MRARSPWMNAMNVSAVESSRPLDSDNNRRTGAIRNVAFARLTRLCGKPNS